MPWPLHLLAMDRADTILQATAQQIAQTNPRRSARTVKARVTKLLSANSTASSTAMEYPT